MGTSERGRLEMIAWTWIAISLAYLAGVLTGEVIIIITGDHFYTTIIAIFSAVIIMITSRRIANEGEDIS